MTVPPDKETMVRELAMHHFYGFQFDDAGNFKRCSIQAPNLWGAIKSDVLPPVELLMISVTPHSAHELISVDPAKLEGVKMVGLIARSTDDVESRMGLSDGVIDWLARLPAKVVSLNKSGFSPITIMDIGRNPALKDRFFLADPEGTRKRPGGRGIGDVNLN